MPEIPLSVDDALARIVASFQPLGSENVPLDESLGRVLADEVVAATDLPPFPSSSMDGYAVRSTDVANASRKSPARLQVVGELVAGGIREQMLSPGQAVRIMTGAPMAPGADAVVPIEMTTEPGPMAGLPLPEHIDVVQKVSEGDYTRKEGQDVRAGASVFSAGHRLRPQDIGMLAALGIAEPRVHRRPRVAVVSIGDELLDASEDLVPGKIRDANSRALLAACRTTGAIPLLLGIAPDNPEKLAGLLDRGVDQNAHLILTSGGISMGAYDFVRTVVEQHGHLEFWRVKMRPGKPLAFGAYRGVPIMALPGNPVSALVTYEVFVRPALAHLGGRDQASRLRLLARTEEEIFSDGRLSYMRAKIRWHDGEFRARLTGSQDSGVLMSLVTADALVIVPEGVTQVKAGEQLEAWLIGLPQSAL
jgi:molybdopterin molybdotransferase